MLGDSKYADMVLICDDREWMAHRLIVCSQSPVIDFECNASTVIVSEHHQLNVVQELTPSSVMVAQWFR